MPHQSQGYHHHPLRPPHPYVYNANNALGSDIDNPQRLLVMRDSCTSACNCRVKCQLQAEQSAILSVQLQRQSCNCTGLG